jgi:hypothetical protein
MIFLLHVANSCQTVNALLETMQLNFLSLVRNSTQSEFDGVCTIPPIAPFTSDFLDRDQIRTFLTDHISSPPVRSELWPCQYAILDERSAIDQTVILAHSYSSLLERDPDIMTEEEAEQWEADCEEYEDEENDSWREWRVAFRDAERLSVILCFEQDFTPKLYNEDFVATHTDVEGILQLRSAFQAFAGAELAT